MEIYFGASADGLKTQLQRQNLSCVPKDLRLWQSCADAITLLAVQGLIAESTVQSARKKLLMRISKSVWQHG